MCIFLQSTSNSQEVLGIGWLGWCRAGSPVTNSQVTSCDVISELSVKQIACAERCLLVLTQQGNVYSVFYSSETQVHKSNFFRTNTAYFNVFQNLILHHLEEKKFNFDNFEIFPPFDPLFGKKGGWGPQDVISTRSNVFYSKSDIVSHIF